MKQRTFLESFIVRPRPVFKPGHHQNYTEAGLEYTTNFESHQVQKCLTCNQNIPASTVRNHNVLNWLWFG
jgi:hypothetical protein